MKPSKRGPRNTIMLVSVILFSTITGLLLFVLFLGSYRSAEGIRHASDDGSSQCLFANRGEIILEFAQLIPPDRLPHWYLDRQFATPRYDEMYGVSNSRLIPIKWGRRSTFFDEEFDIFVPIWVPFIVCVCICVFCCRRLLAFNRRSGSASLESQSRKC